MQNQEYKKSLEDEIDWQLINQLHTATVSFSTTSLELKKLFFVLIGIAVPTIIKLTDNELDRSLFVTLYILTLTFWFLDSYTFYYQEKLRGQINALFTKLRERNNDIKNREADSEHSVAIEAKRTEKNRLIRSVFNWSVSFYILLLILNTVAFTYFKLGVIK